MLEVGFMVLSQIIFVSQREYQKLALRTKPNLVSTTDQMLDGGFVTKASSFKPKPSFFYLKAQINGENVS